MKTVIAEQCMAALQRDDVKGEIRSWMAPVADAVLGEMYPYLYLAGVFLVVAFLLQLATFVVVVRSRGLAPNSAA